jgi:tellurite resistance protein TerB
MFAKLKQKFSGSVQKYSGRKDFLEAVCAAAALVAYADGSADDAEINSMKKAVLANAELSGAFDNRTIELTMETMLSRAEGGRVGRSGLFKEIDDVAADADMAEVVLNTALDVADQGGIDDSEKAMLGKIATSLKLDLSKYL